MAEEQNGEEQEPKRLSPLIKTIVAVGLSVLIPAILGIVTFNLVLRPMLAGGKEEEPAETIGAISPDVVTVKFDEAQATVLAEDPNAPSPLLIYQVAMACANPDTKTLIEDENRKDYFTAMLAKLHRNRTRAELNDPYVQETILKQAKQEANQLLKKLAPAQDFQVIDVMHIKYAIYDL